MERTMSLESTSPGLKELIENFNQDRPVFSVDVITLIGMLQDEVDELKEAEGKEVARELSDVMILVYTIAQWAGIDLEAEVREKVAWNHVRFNAKDFQEGDYFETRKQIKSSKEYEQLKKEFYEIE